ncbi:MAG: exodeoxyribonuclease VII large subunit [Syntrophothermus sp.]
MLSVKELTRLVKEAVESRPALQNVLVRGEVSNFKHHSSGHMYFTLKDEGARLRCVMFRARNIALRFQVVDGMSVIAAGSVGVYEGSGDYQLYVEELFPAGAGSLHLAFEQLKKKLEAEGLFAPEHKRPIPVCPRKVGVITSPTGAAIRDIITVTRRRFPNIHLIIAPAIVQGEAGPASVAAAIELMNRLPDVDVLIVGRGGGSIEELWTFNDETVARAIYNSMIPVISAVGHETDFTIADFVADRRAPTPSAAAEMAVPDKVQMAGLLGSFRTRLMQALRRWVDLRRSRLAALQQSRSFTRPADPIAQWRQQLDGQVSRMAMALKQDEKGRRRELAHLGAQLVSLHAPMTRGKRLQLAELVGRLEGLSPLGTLARGYSICRKPEDGRVIRSVGEVKPDDQVEVLVQDGAVFCRVHGTKSLRYGSERNGG